MLLVYKLPNHNLAGYNKSNSNSYIALIISMKTNKALTNDGDEILPFLKSVTGACKEKLPKRKRSACYFRENVF